MAGRGVTLFEVFRIILEAGHEVPDHVLVDALAAIMPAYFRQRFGGKKGRTKYGAIIGPDGQLVRSFILKDADGEPQDSTDKDKALFESTTPISRVERDSNDGSSNTFDETISSSFRD